MEQYFNKIKARYKEKIDEADSLRGISQKTGAVNAYIEDKDDTIEVLGSIYDMLPDEIYLKGITIDKDGNVFIKGTSKTMSRIFSFVTELENNPFFESVKTEYTESKKDKGEDVSDFGIVMVIEGRYRPEKEEAEE
jgi:Tfp pilus assembly protein PilN